MRKTTKAKRIKGNKEDQVGRENAGGCINETKTRKVKKGT